MIFQIFIGLLLMSTISLFITQGRRKRIWSVLILCGLALISYFFIINLNTNIQTSFIYQWLPYDMIKADFSISASKNIQHMLKPLIFMLSGLVYLNTISDEEQHSLHLNTLLILNFIALILLLSSHDFLQLMFASCMFSVIGFYMPDMILPKKNIFIFNFLSEIAIFTALAVVYGSIHSVSLDNLSEFADKGKHKDIVSALLLFAIGCKCGLLLVNGQYFSLNAIASNRIIGIMLTSMPISSFALLIKVKPLLDATEIANQILPIWIYISLAVFIAIILFNNNIKSKMISLFLSSLALSLHFIYKDTSLLYKLVPYILCTSFLISLSLTIIFISASKETDISFLGGIWRITKTNLFVCMLLFITGMAIFSRIPLNIYEMIFVGFFVLAVSSVFRRVYFFKLTNNQFIISHIKNAGLLYIIPIVCICGWFLWQTWFWMYQNFYIFSAISLLTLIFIPNRQIDIIGMKQIWQSDFLNRFYENVFVRPIKLFGRILWLAFDVMVVERSIIASVSQLSKTIVACMHKIQENYKYSYLFSVLTGLLIMVFYFFYRMYINE